MVLVLLLWCCVRIHFRLLSCEFKEVEKLDNEISSVGKFIEIKLGPIVDFLIEFLSINSLHDRSSWLIFRIIFSDCLSSPWYHLLCTGSTWVVDNN